MNYYIIMDIINDPGIIACEMALTNLIRHEAYEYVFFIYLGHVV